MPLFRPRNKIGIHTHLGLDEDGRSLTPDQLVAALDEVSEHARACTFPLHDPERRRVSAIVLATAPSAASVLDAAAKATATQWGELVKAKSIDARATGSSPAPSKPEAEGPLELAGDLGFVSPPGDPGPRVRGSRAAACEPGCPCSRADGKAVMPCGNAPIALVCGRMVTDTNENNRKIMAPETKMIIGGSSIIGCARSATAPLRTVVRTLSAATASAMSMGAMLGP